MRLLVDTHVLAWFVGGSDLLPLSMRQSLASGVNVVFVSPVSAYEISLKFKRGFWPEVSVLAADFERVCDAAGFIPLPIEARHAREAGALPLMHRDPFDRILAAQSMVEQMPIVSLDGKLDAFPITRVWA